MFIIHTMLPIDLVYIKRYNSFNLINTLAKIKAYKNLGKTGTSSYTWAFGLKSSSKTQTLILQGIHEKYLSENPNGIFKIL